MDFDEVIDAAGGMTGAFIPTARSTDEWWVQNVITGRVLMQILQVGGPATFLGNGKKDQIALQIPLTPSARSRIDGWSLEQDSFVLINEGLPFALTSSETTRWVVIAMPTNHEMLAPEHMQSQMSLLFDTGTTSRTVTKAEHLNTIRHLANRLSVAADNTCFDAFAARYAEEEIVAAVSRILESSCRPLPRQIGRPSFSRVGIIARVVTTAEANLNAPLSIEDLCGVAGVAERTLRNIFQEYFRVGPMRFLKLRQLQQIRRALLDADPARETVTRIAMRFGISDFSLFAHQYKVLFGESPSHSLRTASKRARQPLASRDTWMEHAARTFSLS